MTEMPDAHDRNDAVRGAREALLGSTDPDAHLLEAVQDGLLSVSAGSPTSWFDVPSQRSPRHYRHLTPRRPD
ncbi:hypothetical protein [Cellulomonas alba]|uniref:Uncharacterized protein n=1 Tax=Cellulomonas alba TaxID=3053467 RepID=A0ABT7SHU0_9CELL|nr:hypothetical protein [Cellulomonas alba]MDM7855122.1 hypothetical protein [Cellulomonas alba]